MTSESDSDSYQSDPTLFTDLSKPVARIHPGPFHGGIIGGGPTYFPSIIIGIPTSGPNTTSHIVVGMMSTSSVPTLATPH